MKTIEISITRAAVFTEIVRITSFLGFRFPIEAGDSVQSRFERVRAAGNDSSLIERFWSAETAALTGDLKDYVSSADYPADEYYILLSVSGSYDDSQTPSLRASIFNRLVAAILARWLRITLPSEARSFEEEATFHLREIHRRLCHRLPPVRKP